MTMEKKQIIRCPWAGSDPLYIAYHDLEWGFPVHDDIKLFEAVVLDGFQAGLSWLTILRKREFFRKAFDNWDVNRIARYDTDEIARLMSDPGIIRNKLKVQAAITNARAFLKVQEEFGTFDAFIWEFTGGKPLVRRERLKTLSDIPVRTAESDAMSLAMKKRGFKFVGSVICYAFMQAVGMVDDHLAECFRAQE